MNRVHHFLKTTRQESGGISVIFNQIPRFITDKPKSLIIKGGTGASRMIRFCIMLKPSVPIRYTYIAVVSAPSILRTNPACLVTKLMRNSTRIVTRISMKNMSLIIPDSFFITVTTVFDKTA